MSKQTPLQWLVAAHRTATPDTCRIWPYSVNRQGYGQLRNLGTVVGAHRASFALRHGYYPEVARHTCDNPSCVNPHHLLAGTHADNEADKVARCRQARGTKHGNTKLTEADVLAIYASTGPASAVAAQFNTSRNAVYHIRKELTWKWLTRPE